MNVGVKRKVVASIVIIVLAAVAYWVYNTSFVVVSVSGGSAPYTYSFYNQKTGATDVVSSDSSLLKKRLRSGNYEVLVRHNNTSSFLVAKTGHFFRSTQTSMKLVSENTRQFIGDNPSDCMSYLGNTLVSYACDAAYRQLRIHVPASNTTPSYVLTNSRSDVDGYINGFVGTGQGTFALVFSQAGFESNAQYYLYRVRSDLSQTDRMPLNQLDTTKIYSVKPYKQGLLIYDNDLNSVYYLSSFKGKLSKLNIDIPSGGSLNPASLDISGDDIVVAYTGKSGSTAATWNNTTTTIQLKDSLKKVVMCGNQILCGLNDGGVMSVYRLSGSQASVAYRVYGVKDISNSVGGILAVREHDVLHLNPAAGSGYDSYSLGDYKLNRVSFGSGYYLLNLTNNKNRKVALRVDISKPDIDSIDKKVAQLQKIAAVSVVSIYKNHVFITPELGELEFDPKVGYLRPDPKVLANITGAINKEIDSLGINRDIYSVLITH